jgi:hypothetical protein
MTTVHDRLATAVILYTLILGLWGLVGALRGGVSGSYRGSLVIGEGLLIVQSLLGVALLIGGSRPALWVHFLYGALIPLMLPFAVTLGRRRSGQTEALLYAGTSLFIFGMALRAVATGS